MSAVKLTMPEGLFGVSQSLGERRVQCKVIFAFSGSTLQRLWWGGIPQGVWCSGSASRGVRCCIITPLPSPPPPLPPYCLPLQRRVAGVPGRRLLVRIARLEHRHLVKRCPRELKADRQAGGAEPTGQRQGWEPGEIEERRVNKEVFRRQETAHGRLRANPSRHEAGGGEHKQVDGLELLQHPAADLLAGALGLQVGGGTDQDACRQRQAQVWVIIPWPFLEVFSVIGGGVGTEEWPEDRPQFTKSNRLDVPDLSPERGHLGDRRLERREDLLATVVSK
jgi:hypothetical protein